MRVLPVRARRELERRDDEWVKKARELTRTIGKDDKERQLRNVQSIAETSRSWEAVSLFMRYQAARGQLDKAWAEKAVSMLDELRRDAQTLAGSSDPSQIRDVHMELVARTLGYAVRWHVWDTKGKEKSS